MEHILHKTLIIRFSSVGDIVLSSLLVRTLRRRFPECQIDFLVKAEFAELVGHSPFLTRVIEFPTGGTLRDLLQLRHTLRSEGYDLIVDIHDSIRSRVLSAGARHVVRFRKRKIARFLLVAFKRDLYRFFGGAPSVARRYLETVGIYGVTDDGGGLDQFLPPAAAEKPTAILRTAGISPQMSVIGLCPSARHATKIWPSERFADVALTLLREERAAVLLFGSDEDRVRGAEIEERIRAAIPDARMVNLTGQLTLSETAAAMDRCSLIITNDSGLMHLAAARKRKILAVFGSTVKQFGFFPFGTLSEVVEHPDLPCRPCSHIGLPACPKSHFKCMRDISVEHVVATARRLLAA
jgi:lipopolysaccharide heptosyltransferase II